MTRLAPTGRGAEPQVSTTVASATARPSLRQSSAALRISLSVESIRASVAANGEQIASGEWLGQVFYSLCVYSPIAHSLCLIEYRQLGDLLHPDFRIPRPPATHLQRGDQIGDR